ncbi:hypothetical protein [Actinoplanes sp. NPDC049599]|uniref:hypothetical protein n=1 Tax=Actinoplanes sp. NPDC049599 TaxID=3363903 RepID=UPI0037BAB456
MRNRYETIFNLVHLALLTNLLLVCACLPMIVALLTTDPGRSWPLLALLAPGCAPGLCATFAVLAAFTADRSTPVATTFLRAWRATFRRAFALGALTCAALVVLGVDARAAWGRPIGAAVIPVLLTGMTLIVATALLVTVVLAEQPAVRLRDAGRVCLYLAVRRWYLTVVSLAVLALLHALLASRPALALGLAATPMLYVVWANSRFTLEPSPLLRSAHP